jgi:hypothetical protein
MPCAPTPSQQPNERDCIGMRAWGGAVHCVGDHAPHSNFASSDRCFLCLCLCFGHCRRYDALRACVGEPVVKKLAESRLFMVGCGAIGCEMLKNYALLGVGTAGKGNIVVTDNDVIEKSNLNRQFLFRPEHIRSPKSEVAASSVLQINPDMRIEAHQHKVGPDTTKVGAAAAHVWCSHRVSSVCKRIGGVFSHSALPSGGSDGLDGVHRQILRGPRCCGQRP